jgi:tetratricopeptide (TPR) repeat protein
VRADWGKVPGSKAVPLEVDLGLADSYYAQQKYKDAAPLYASVAPRLAASKAAIQPWERLADSYSKQRLNAEAADAWKRALDLRKTLQPDDSGARVTILFARGLALLETGRTDEADGDLREWLPLRLRQPDPLNSEETQALDRLSQRLTAASQFASAELYLRQLLVEMERPGASAALLNRTRIALAEACAAQGKNQEAATFYELQAAHESVLKRTPDAQKYLLRAKELREKDASDPSALVTTLEDLASADVMLRQFDDAKALNEQARKTLQDLGYQQDWRLAVALKGLGDVSLQQALDFRGKGDERAQQSFDTALEQYNQANDLVQKAPATPRRVRAAVLFQLGSLASYNKKPEEAAKYFDECLALALNAQANDPPPVDQLDGIAQFYVGSQRFDEAEQLYQRTLELRGKVFGEDSVEYAWGLQGLTDFYITRQSPKAVETGEKSLHLFEAKAGPDSDEAAMGLQVLASVYRQSGNVPLAIQSLERALEILRKTGPMDRNKEQLMLAELGAYYRGQKNYPKTLATYQRMAQLWQDQGIANANYQLTLQNLAVAYEDAKDHVHGEETFQQLRTALKGRPDEETRLLLNFGDALKRNGNTKEADRLLKEAKSDRK